MGNINYTDKNGSFKVEDATNTSYLYFPLASEQGIKSAVTPTLGGDIKLDQNSFLMEPVSSENIQENRGTRNFWCGFNQRGAWSATGVSAEEMSAKFTDRQEKMSVEAGMLWHKVTRESVKYQLQSEVLSFAPINANVEIMKVTITNTGRMEKSFTPVAAVPIYGRSADNIRDHRHVTSLLHRISCEQWGVLVKPTLSFDERGHRINERSYFVGGVAADGSYPVEFYPVVEDFVGEGGNLERPCAVLKNEAGLTAGSKVEGLEAMGGLKFAEVTLQPEESVSFVVVMGITDDENSIADTMKQFGSVEAVAEALKENQEYWENKVNVSFETGSKDFDGAMRWVALQPDLRRLFGCSFLPHHDYGRGGRGWRDLWQDCLALLIMNPKGVGEQLLNNFAGVRVDGSNATIIGSKPGEFVADRNNITRVWMDHGVWPYMTTRMYIDQTGDIDILGKKVKYFKDRQVLRGTAHDDEWNETYGLWQKDDAGKEYEGTVLEHLLLQNLTAFYEVGEHNLLRLRGADWNDAIDMAADRGESVAFSNAYAGNLMGLAEVVEAYGKKSGCNKVEILAEIEKLLINDAKLYDSIADKTALLAEYGKACEHNVSGKTVEVEIQVLAASLRSKGAWLMEQIRKQEWVSDGQGNCWFNGYYDNSGRQVEGVVNDEVRMMLTSQVFSVMCGTASDEQVVQIAASADKYLYFKERGGYALNTDFHEVKTDMGRMFGFSYGDKENGAVFSHMTTMYGNALYKRGFVQEGYKALNTLLGHSMDYEKSKIYPGIPEYFNGRGRGMYHYLTGAASWFLLTMVTEVFGVKGSLGDLVIEPKLVAEQFDAQNTASMSLVFAGQKCRFVYSNASANKTCGYKVKSVKVDGEMLADVVGEDGIARIARSYVGGLDTAREHVFEVVLG